MQPNEEARNALLTEINDMSDDILNKNPSAETWSIKQIVEHLFMMEGVVVKMVENQLENGEKVQTEEKPIELSVDRKQKVEAPDYATPSDHFETLEELKLKLEASHQGLLQLAASTNEQELEQKAFPHPIFGEMSLKQWLPFIGWHEKRHILQIQEVKEMLGIRE